ncbi:MAG: hypothetical protein L0332_05670 [Chloroflexi bacterium]|nr:hypothetical protein [Chloroflexota bacterium]MCI0575048.1 hypothetical protein [Chloroflexota bacterium]MCI0643574.1 hypothetical protein [Chloroflexota bacterium]MCI0726196.1 hypothetical protein [Chloroflexota bacterium]
MPSWRVLGLLVASLLVFGLAYWSPVTHFGSDPYLTLLVSQALVEHHTFQLDAYQESVIAPPGGPNFEGQTVRYNEHIYYYFPPGTSILAAPAVWLAREWGLDMARPEDNDHMQNLLSALLCVLVFVLLYQTAVCYLEPATSLAIAGVSALGSSLISTLGTALWSSNFAVLWLTLSLWLIVRHESGRSQTLHPYLLGVSLFGAYFCRPTVAVFIFLVLVYLLLWQRRFFLPTAVVSAGLLALFLLSSRITFGDWLPPYYTVQRFQANKPPLWVPLYGLFLSPSRGLFIFSPFLALALGLALWQWRSLRRWPLFWLCLAWVGLHLFVASRASRWFGGHGFGPRLLVDLMPGLVLLTILVWTRGRPALSGRARRLLTSAYLALGAWAIFVNTIQGLYNLQAARWNGNIAPDIDRRPQALLDWRYPQFLANSETLCTRNQAFINEVLAADPGLKAYQPGWPITYRGDSYADYYPPDITLVRPASAQVLEEARPLPGSPAAQLFFPLVVSLGNEALFAGWSTPESGTRWSECQTARILFLWGETSVDQEQQYWLALLAGSFGDQEVGLSLNGVTLGRYTFAGRTSFSTYLIPFDGRLLKPGEVNEVTFDLPGATQAANQKDPRRLGLAFVSLTIYEGTGD